MHKKYPDQGIFKTWAISTFVSGDK